MSCSRPLTAFVCGKLQNGKKDIRFATFKDQTCYVKDGIPYTEKIEIPCGQCIGCRLQYSRQWADRMMMELEDHEDAWFLTLTYDDEHVPVTYYGNPESGDAIRAYTLRKKHLQDFFKRIRNYYPDTRLRYFACGELGEVSKRPHYHAIVYGLKTAFKYEDRNDVYLNDLEYYKRSDLSDIYYVSEKLNRIWKNGYCVIGSVSWESCAYVARYVVKKAKGISKEAYDMFNMEPEFVLMSRKPGIAKGFYDRNISKIYSYNNICISTDKGGIKCKAPRYFNQKTEELFGKDAEFYKKYKENLSIKGKLATKAKLDLSGYELEELREIEESAIIQKTKALRREL